MNRISTLTRRHKTISCLLLMGISPLAAWAQTAPDAGQIQRQIERTLTPPAATPPSPTAPAQPVDRSGPAVVVQRFVIEGASLIPAEELARQLDPYRGQALTLGELQAAAQTLAGYYRQRGWFARVQLPPQDITSGTVRIEIVEGRFGSLQLQPGDTRANSAFVGRVANQSLDAGQPYSLAELERGLLLANDLPGIAADGVLQAGRSPGTSDLVLNVKDRPLFSGSLGANDYGSRFTGRTLGNARVALNDPSGYGDQLSLAGMVAEHLDYQGLGYSVPLGHDGLRANVGYSQLHYRLGKDFAALDAKGDARTASAGLAYPLVRSTARNVWASLDYAHNRYSDGSLGETLHQRSLDSLALALFGDSRDAWGGGGQSTWRATATQGRGRLRLDDDRAQDAAGPGTAGDFTRLNVDLWRDQVLAPAWYLRARFAGQLAVGNLYTSQQFSLGGPYGVRGYPLNEASGDSGAVLQMELHSPLPPLNTPGLDGYAFFDAGLIRQHQTLWPGWDTQGTGHNTYGLASTGIGLGWSHPRGFNANAVLAIPLGANRGNADSDRNQDGSRKGPRLWISITQMF